MSWRISKQSPDHGERVRRTCSAAWRASAVRIRPIEERVRAAKSMEGRARRLGKYEREVLDEVNAMGGRLSWQTTIGPYNVDLAFREERVAVEIQRQAVRTDRLSGCSMRRERVEYILNRGWHLVVVFCPDRFHWVGRRTKSGHAQSIDVAAVAEYLVAAANELRGKPSTPGEYRVIRGDAKPCTTRSVQLDRLPES
jgi:very-short-patch-repair endonuclease